MNLKVTPESRSSLAGFIPVRGSRDFGKTSVMQRPRNLPTVKCYISVLYDFSCVLGTRAYQIRKNACFCDTVFVSDNCSFPVEHDHG